MAFEYLLTPVLLFILGSSTMCPEFKGFGDNPCSSESPFESRELIFDSELELESLLLIFNSDLTKQP